MRLDRLTVCTAVSWLGLWVHELHRVPSLLGFTPDGDLFMLVIAVALAYWWSRSNSAVSVVVMLGYSAINLVAGVLTVLPLGWLPFAPEQTASHYAVHLVYAVSQLPLLFVTTAQVIRRRYVPARGGSFTSSDSGISLCPGREGGPRVSATLISLRAYSIRRLRV